MTYMQNKGTDFKSLATDLKSSDNRLISSCTMDGRSHEELHLWLAPHLNLVSKLSKAGSPEEAEKVIGQLGNSFATFNQYFE